MRSRTVILGSIEWCILFTPIFCDNLLSPSLLASSIYSVQPSDAIQRWCDPIAAMFKRQCCICLMPSRLSCAVTSATGGYGGGEKMEHTLANL